jgi:hypothetical protein
MQVRRLTPVECERLQGFPDGYTNIPWRGKAEAPDGPRYKALGNSMAVPVMHWIGKRIAAVADILEANCKTTLELQNLSGPHTTRRMAEGKGFEPLRGMTPNGFQVRESVLTGQKKKPRRTSAPGNSRGGWR